VYLGQTRPVDSMFTIGVFRLFRVLLLILGLSWDYWQGISQVASNASTKVAACKTTHWAVTLHH
jgi:hypothetical protein